MANTQIVIIGARYLSTIFGCLHNCSANTQSSYRFCKICDFRS